MMESRRTVHNTFNARRRAGGLASLSAAFLMTTGCATTLKIPEEAVAISEFSATKMQSEDPLQQAEGHLTFLHYVLANGGEDFRPYFETSPELMVILDDYKNLDESGQERVRDILNNVDYMRPSTRLEAMEQLADILPGFQDPLESAPEQNGNGDNLHREPARTVSVRKDDNRLIFDLSGSGPGGP